MGLNDQCSTLQNGASVTSSTHFSFLRLRMQLFLLVRTTRALSGTFFFEPQERGAFLCVANEELVHRRSSFDPVGAARAVERALVRVTNY